MSIFLVLSTMVVISPVAVSGERNYFFVQFKYSSLEKCEQLIETLLQDLGYDDVVEFHRYLGSGYFVCEIPSDIVHLISPQDFILGVELIKPEDKISSDLDYVSGSIDIIVSTYELNDVSGVANAIDTMGGVITRTQNVGVPRIWANIPASLVDEVAEVREVFYIELDTDEIDFLNRITTTTYMGMDAAQAAGFTGSGIMGEVQDNGCDMDHPDFSVDYYDGSISTLSHGTCTYGIVFSLGTNNMDTQGVLPDAVSVFADYEDNSQYNSVAHVWNGEFTSGNAGMNGLFQSNSWGHLPYYGYGGYNSITQEADQASYDYSKVLVLWAAGNSNNGVQKGSLTFEAQCKNGLTVGAVWHRNTADMSDDDWHSEGAGNTPSQGPCPDGRQKPDVVGPFDWIYCTDVAGSGGYSSGDYYSNFGGTSGATPCVAGIAGLTYEMYIENHFGNNPTGNIPSSAMVKAIIIADAYQYPLSSSDRDSQGWGSADAEQIYTLGSTYHMLFDDASVSEGGSWSRQIYSDGSMPLKITLVWNDPPAPETTGSARALRNNLDLKVTGPDGTTAWYGNNGLYDNLWSSSGTGTNHWTRNNDHRDDLNNVENVFIQNPSVGTYTIEVFGRSGDMYTSPQSFAVAAAGAKKGNPPRITITSPNGGENLQVGTTHDITWTTTPGDGSITNVDLQYSTNNGGSWTTIVTGTEDDGTYTWTIPDTPSTECLVKGIVHDDLGMSGEDISDSTFSINDGVPPNAPSNLTVKYYGLVNMTLLDDNVEGGDLGYTTGGTENWVIRTHGAHSGSYSWDFGNGNYVDPSNGGLSYLYTPLINLSGKTSARLSFWHWRDFESNTVLWDGGNVKISTDGGGSWSLLSNPNPPYDGPARSGYDNPLAGEQVYGYNRDWEQVTIDLTPYVGNSVYIRWEAGVDNWATSDAGWRIDDILVTAQAETGTSDNLLSWTASSDDGGGTNDVHHYNIYRADNANGPWETVHAEVTADGSSSYTYVDSGAGEADSTTWWYVVRAEDTGGLEDSNTNAVSEPVPSQPPVANDDSYTTKEDTVLNVAAPGVLANDVDPENDPLTAVLVDSASNGDLTLYQNGSFIYTPSANYYGSDSFTYRANDGTSNSNVATVTITVTSVNDPPVANSGPDQTLADDDGNGYETVTLNGSASYDIDGTITNYTWKEGANILGYGAVITTDLSVGVHTITLTVTDNDGATDNDTTVVTVNANQPPTCTITADPSSGVAPLTVTFSMSASDADGTIASWELDVDNDGTAEYSGTGNPPASQQHTYNTPGTYTAELTVTDNGGATGTDTTVVTVTANNPPDTPTNPSPPDGATNVSLSPTLSVYVNDPDGDTMTVSFYQQGGTLIGNDTVAGSGTATTTWTDANQYSTTYYWYTVANDSTASTQSPTWSFTTIPESTTYTEDFESPLGGEWSTYSSTSYGRNERSTYSANSGSYSWRMDVTSSGNYNLNELILHVQVSDASYLNLRFHTREYYDEQNTLPSSFTGHYNGDGIAVSTNGNNWVKLWQYPSYVSSWTQYGPFDISDLISIDGDVYIKFQQYDNYVISWDGILWDDIELETDGTITT